MKRKPLIQNVTRNVIRDAVTTVINPHGVPGDPNLPLHITDECKVWLDGKDAGQFTLDGTYVDDWIGKGSHAANTNADATRPTYDINTGRVTFIAANETFLQSAAFDTALTQPNTIFIVYKITGVIAHQEFVFGGLTGDYRQDFYYQFSEFRITGSGPDVIVGTATNANVNIHCGEFNGANSNYWINGILSGNGEAGTDGLDGVTLGSFYGLSIFADAEISELIIYNADISDVDRVKIEGYLSKKYDIPVTTD